MSQSNTGTRIIHGFSKNVINILFFLLSVVAVSSVIAWNGNNGGLAFAGTLIIVTSCFILLYFFLFQFNREVLHVTRKVLFILLAIIMFVTVTKAVVNFSDRRFIWLIPFAIIPVVIRTFYDARLAVIVLIIALLLCGFFVPEPFEFVFINSVTGMAAIYSLKKVYRKTRLFYTAIVVILTCTFLWAGIRLME